MCLYVAGCYGVDPATVSKDWKCARCKANAMTEVSEVTRVDFLYTENHWFHRNTALYC